MRTPASTIPPSVRVFVLFLLGFSSGCNSYLARRVVTAPNLKDPIRGIDASQQTLDAMFIARQLRVSVGPPDATLSVWIGEPNHRQEDITLTGDGRRIYATITTRPSTMPASNPVPKGTVFLLHGIEDHKELGPYVLYREMLVHAGYRVVQVDCRGHGRSTGDWITYGVVESRDLTQVLDVLEREGLIAGEVGVMGVSYGASVAIQWAAADSRVHAVVALEPFATLEDVSIDAASLVLGHYRWLFSDNDIRDALRRAGQLAGFDPADASPLAAMPKLRAPVLLIHSAADEMIPIRHSQRLRDANPLKTMLIQIENQSHFSMWLDSRGVIDKFARMWMDQYLTHEPPQPTTQPPTSRNTPTSDVE